MAYLRALLAVAGDFFGRLGVLRSALVVAAVFAIALVPPAEGRTVYEGMGFVRTVVIPTLAPLVLTGLLLDALMCRVLMSDAEPAVRDRLRLALRTELLMALVLVLAWVPFFINALGVA